MKKYGKLMAIAAAAFFVSALPTSAKEYTLEEFGKKMAKDYSTAGYVYVIGDYAFTSNHTLTMQDVMLAARSIKLTEEEAKGKTNKDDAYKKMAMHYIEQNGDAWEIGNPEFGEGKLPDDSTKKFNIVYIDYDFAAKNYIVNDVDPTVDAAVKELNNDAKTFGFNEITFTEQEVESATHKTITFAVHDLNEKVSTYAETAASMFKKVLIDSGLELKEIKYTLKDNNEKTVSADEIKRGNGEIVKLAKELIKNMTNVEDGQLANLTYAALIGKEAHATFVFEVDGQTYQEDYYVTFTYNFEEDKDLDLSEAAETLNKTAAQYGFREITYNPETNTAEFAIQDDSIKLSEYAESGIVDMFTKYITGATKVKYTYGSVSKDITFNTDGNNPNKENAVKWAKDLLCLMSQDSDSAQDSNTSCNAASLILADVAGKEATAEITYQLNGGEEKTIEYTLKFTYDLDEVKNYELTDSASKLNEELKSKEKDYGFSSVTYNPETRMIEFEVSNEGSKLVNFATSGIMDMFVRFADNATEVKYTVNNQEYTENIIDSTLSGVDVKKFAARLLMRMAGKNVDNDDSKLAQEAVKLTVADVAGKEAKATFTFVVDGEETAIEYNLKFNYDVEEVKKSELTTFAEQLNDKLKQSDGTEYGFESITYNPEDGKVTFTAKQGQDSTTLVTFAGSGIINMFETFITNATSVKYKVNGDDEYKEPITLNDDKSLNIMELAATLLLDMAGQNDSATSVTSTSSSQDWSKAKALKISDVTGKSAEAVFTYKVGEETKDMTFTLEFVSATATE